MDDKFLYDLRREPRPEFVRQLRASLRQMAEMSGQQSGLRAAKWMSLAASVALVGIAFTLPSVRAGAEAFLDLFRIVNVAGISINAERLNEIEFDGLDLPGMIGDQIEILTPSGPVVTYESIDEAGAAAGSRVLVPAFVPVGWERSGIYVSGERAARITADTTMLRQLMELLAIDDLVVPADLDGQIATLHVPPVVTLTYQDGDRQFRLLQSLTPEVSFPAGLDLPVLAEIGMRILGLETDEAYRFAQNIDWRTTLIVPVPTEEAAFRQVNIAGNEGLLIDRLGAREYRPGVRGSGIDKLLLWASDDRVFAISGSLASLTIIEIAQSLQ